MNLELFGRKNKAIDTESNKKKLTGGFFGVHKVALALSLLVGIIFVAHDFSVPYFLNGQSDRVFSPVSTVSDYDTGTMYAPRLNASFNGSLFLGDIYLNEYKNGPALLPILPPIVLGGLAKILGSPSRAIIFTDFLFPAIIFFLTYLIVFEITRKKKLALLIASFFIFLPEIGVSLTSPTTSSLTLLSRVFFPIYTEYTNLSFLRFDYPKITYIFYLATILFSYCALRKPCKLYTILGGIFFGALFYSYLYDWVYIFISFCLLSGILLLFKKRTESFTVLKIISIGFLISVFYWQNYISLHNLPQYLDISGRVGIEIGRGFRAISVGSILRSVVLSGLVFFIYRKRHNLELAFIVSMLLPIGVVLNMQIITNFNPAPDHWHRMQFLPIILCLAVLSGFVWDYILSRVKYLPASKLKLLVTLIILSIFGQHLYTQTIYAKNTALLGSYSIGSKIRDSLDWLNQNTDAGSVVGSFSYETSADISSFTKNISFIPKGLNTSASNDELWNRIIYLGKILELPEVDFKKVIEDSSLILFVFNDYYRSREINSFWNSTYRMPPPDVYGDVMRRFNNKSIIYPYKVQYVYVGQSDRSLNMFSDKSTNSKKVFDNGEVQIYKIN